MNRRLVHAFFTIITLLISPILSLKKTLNDNEHCIELLGVLWQRTLGDKSEAMKNIIAAVGTKLEYAQP